MTIDEVSIKIPIAWLVDDKFVEEILGREKLFDAFDIEFRQRKEEIVFKYLADL